MCEAVSDEGLMRMGFISAQGTTRHASACNACARPISRPSGVAAEFKDMFCALKGRDANPLVRKNPPQSRGHQRFADVRGRAEDHECARAHFFKPMSWTPQPSK